MEADLVAWARSREADNIPSLKVEISRAVPKGHQGEACGDPQELVLRVSAVLVWQDSELQVLVTLAEAENWSLALWTSRLHPG